MIYFVDEDKNELEPYVYELSARGYSCKILKNADDALESLQIAKDVELAIIDVMLATSMSNESKFDAISTNNFTTTGLVLLKRLVGSDGDFRTRPFPSRVILFSSARIEQVVSKIESMAAMYHIPYLDKNEFSSTPEFADRVELHLKGMEK